MRGGYKIVDFKKEALKSGSEANIAGAYAAVINPYNKATLITGLIVGGVAYPDFYAPFVSNSGTFESSVVIGGNTIAIEIAEGDDVTVTVIAPTGD